MKIAVSSGTSHLDTWHFTDQIPILRYREVPNYGDQWAHMPGERTCGLSEFTRAHFPEKCLWTNQSTWLVRYSPTKGYIPTASFLSQLLCHTIKPQPQPTGNGELKMSQRIPHNAEASSTIPPGRRYYPRLNSTDCTRHVTWAMAAIYLSPLHPHNLN